MRILGKWSLNSERLNWDQSAGTDSRPWGMSLKSTCMRIVAKNARNFRAETLEMLDPRLLAEIWAAVVTMGRDSLETWLLFVSFGLDVHPVYRCLVSDLSDVPVQLRGTLCCEYPRHLKECVVVPPQRKFDTALLRTLSSFQNLRCLDLRLGIWPDLSEAKHFLNMLLKNMRRGSFQTLECLRLPRRGPKFLKTALKCSWPHSLKLIQTPVKPLDGWRRADARELDAWAELPLFVHYGSCNAEFEYTSGCFKR